MATGLYPSRVASISWGKKDKRRCTIWTKRGLCYSHLFCCRGHFLLLCDFFRQNFGRRKDLNGSFILQNIPLRGAQNLFIKVIQKRCNCETKLHVTWQSNGFNTFRILSSISFNCFLLLALSTMRVFFISSSSGFSSAARIPSSWS